VVAVFTGGNYGTILEIQVFGMLINYLIPAILPSPPEKVIKLADYLINTCVGEYRSITNENIFSVFREADNLYINISYEKRIRIFPKKPKQILWYYKLVW
jgi:hypothetical protein